MNASFSFASKLAGSLLFATALLAPSVARAEDAPSALAPRATAWAPAPGTDAAVTHMRSPTLFGFGLGLTAVGAAGVTLGVVAATSAGAGSRCVDQVKQGATHCTGLANPLEGLGIALIAVGASQIIGGTTMAIIGGTSVKELRGAGIPTASVGPRSMSLRWVF